MPLSAKQAILAVLPVASSEKWTAVHELRIAGYSENALATRLSELARSGQVIGRTRPGKQFKEWAKSQVVMATIGGSDPT